MKNIDEMSLIECYYMKFNMHRFFRKDMRKKVHLFQFDKNEYICKEGEELKYFFFFVHGKAKLFRTLPNGRTVLFAFYQPVSVIGDIEVVKNQAASCTMQALRECYCIAIPIEVARKELSEDSVFMKFLCESLAQKLYVISMNSSMHMIYPLENRLAGYIYETLGLAGQEKESEDNFFDEQLGNLAELLGTSYRHLLRTLAGICAKGVLKKEKKGYRVVNTQLLKELAGDLYQNPTI